MLALNAKVASGVIAGLFSASIFIDYASAKSFSEIYTERCKSLETQVVDLYQRKEATLSGNLSDEMKEVVKEYEEAKAERESAASGGGSTLEKRERIKAADARVERALRAYDMLPESKRNPNEFENLIDETLARWAAICAR